MLAGIKAAANGHIAATEHDGMSAVIDGNRQPMFNRSRSNDRGCAVLCRIVIVVATNGNMIAIDSSGTEVVLASGFPHGRFPFR